MVIRKVELETVCGITSKIPDNTLPEIAFAGKSNVGKSSLINALMNRRSLARISSKPGKTQTINFYNINKEMYLVDLPGYGYATAREEIRAQWGTMIEHYLHTSKQLTAVFLLIDIRHSPSENDRLMYHWMLDQGFAPVIIATKKDKLKRSQVDRHIEAIRGGLRVEPETVIIPFSAETKEGRQEIWSLMEKLAGLGETADASAPSKAKAEKADEVREPFEVKAGETAGGSASVKETAGETDGDRGPSEVKAGETAGGSASVKETAGEADRDRASSKIKADDADGQKQRKPRWKASGHSTAKKTVRNRKRRRNRS